MKRREKTNKTGQQGFTLVEILVSLAIFLLVIAVVLQLFFYAGRAHRIILAKSQIMGEMAYNLEHISRGLRMAKKTQDENCLSEKGRNFKKTDRGGIKFQAVNSSGQVECIEYYVSNGVLMEHRRNSEREFDLPITSPAINVSQFSIAEYGWLQTDWIQPRVTLRVRMEGKENQSMENQITVSQRDLDIEE